MQATKAKQSKFKSRKQRIAENIETFTLAPASIPQEQFLATTSDITLYSGSAGAGKSFAIILTLVKYAMLENTTAVVFRRTSTQIRQNGGIWQESCTVFKKVFGKDVSIRNRDLEIYIAKTNATIKFSHLQHQSDVSNHLGAQYSLIIFDEATLFPFEEMILPLLGRLRNANVSYKPRMMWATNPAYNHGIYHWIKDFYLDEFGVPLKEKSNVERFMYLQNNQPIWYETRKEAEAIHGSGNDSGILSFRSIRAHVTDNIPLMKANPAYLNNLKALPEIKRRIFLDGSWTAREEEAGLYLRTMSRIVPFPNIHAIKRVRVFDMASQPVSTQSPNPDWTRGLLVSKDKLSTYTIEDLVSLRDRPHVVEQLIFETARQDRATYGQVTTVLPVDPGQAGVARANELKRKLAEQGFSCILVKPHTSKRTRFLPFSAIAEAGYVQVVKADWNETFFCELEEFTGLVRHERDDIVDCCSDAVYVLNKTLELPTFSLPSLSTGPSFGFQDATIPSDMTVSLFNN